LDTLIFCVPHAVASAETATDEKRRRTLTGRLMRAEIIGNNRAPMAGPVAKLMVTLGLCVSIVACGRSGPSAGARRSAAKVASSPAPVSETFALMPARSSSDGGNRVPAPGARPLVPMTVTAAQL
jgi:hypothetical protein